MSFAYHYVYLLAWIISLFLFLCVCASFGLTASIRNEHGQIDCFYLAIFHYLAPVALSLSNIFQTIKRHSFCCCCVWFSQMYWRYFIPNNNLFGIVFHQAHCWCYNALIELVLCVCVSVCLYVIDIFVRLNCRRGRSSSSSSFTFASIHLSLSHSLLTLSSHKLK